MQYFATVLSGEAKAVLDAAELLVKIHSRATGPEPVTGRRGIRSATPTRCSAPASWRAWAAAAHFQTIDPDAVPRNRAGVREYFERYRPKLVGSEVAQDMMDFLLDASQYLVPKRIPAWLRLVITRGVRMGVVAPRAVPVVAPVPLGVPPERDVIWFPAEAYRHFGKQTPREQYATLIGSGTAPQPYPVHHHEPVVEFAAGKAPRTA
ncbi:oxygenase MpaB family protein [Amycolatopsis thermophila]|uniref:ER-bound oxygenase mpaB/mpaB'/Rubber oxygenase catalytic domain-containing protein n=1 Tax=Amycolatopsis thermophila TaxID=206084 RepID=A0ABU0F2F3_9PSEU|nr:oxygenase MpaB family protein [Amycolatopsis thermophila]MDQ0381701.1 hypothetical protein [Amycolatopsis thermophila]